MNVLVRGEITKLHGSLALLFALLVPALPAILVGLSFVSAQTPPPWSAISDRFVLPLWAMFLFPMASAALSTLLGQIEHRARSWDQLLISPYPRWEIYASKAMVAFMILAGMTLLAPLLATVVAWTAGTLSGKLPTGPFGTRQLMCDVARFFGASLFALSIQFWTALRYGNFVVPLAVGIGGTLVGLAAVMTGSRDADWFPWVMPIRAVQPGTGTDPMYLGLAGGALVILVAIIDLSRRSPA